MIGPKPYKTLCEQCFNEECSCKGKQNRSWDKHNKCSSFKTEEDIINKVEDEDDDYETQYDFNNMFKNMRFF